MISLFKFDKEMSELNIQLFFGLHLQYFIDFTKSVSYETF